MRLTKKICRIMADRAGNFSIMFAIGLMMILTAVGVGVETTQLMSQKIKSQDQADLAALVAAKYMRDNLTSDQTLARSALEAKAIVQAKDAISEYMGDRAFKAAKSDFEFTDEVVKVSLNVERKTMLMGMFGYKTLSHNVSATTGLSTGESKDIDIVLMTDATGSMATTLAGIQANMKDFSYDLQQELNKHNIVQGTVRI